MNPYAPSDREMARLKQYIAAQFQNASVLPIDELNIMGVRKRVRGMYDRIEQMIEAAMRRVASEAASEFAEVDSAAIVAAVLAMYHPVTEYVYRRELSRKEDRLVESLVANGESRQAVRRSYSRASRLLTAQVGFYLDICVDEARHAAMREAGVTHVVWVTQMDGRTCETCRERNGRVYDIDNVPDKPHLGCRCYTLPVAEG